MSAKYLLFTGFPYHIVTIQHPMRKTAVSQLFWITSLLVICLLWLLRHINCVKYAYE